MDGTEIFARGHNYGDPKRGRHRVIAFFGADGKWRDANDEDSILLYLTEWLPHE